MSDADRELRRGRSSHATTPHLQSCGEPLDQRETMPGGRSLGAVRQGLQDFQGLAQKAVQLVRQELSLDVAWVGELSTGLQTLTAVAGGVGTLDLEPGSEFAREHSVCERMLSGEIPSAVPDVEDFPALSALPAIKRGVRSYVGVPVKLTDGRIIGTLCAAGRAAAPGLGDESVKFLSVLAGVLAEQRQQSERDAEGSRAHAELTAIRALAAALDARDHYTAAHSEVVVELSRAVAHALGLEHHKVEEVGHVALLHDLGKIGVPDAILLKPGPLSEHEWEQMREHPVIGARIVASIGALAHLADACRAEHEHWDGSGYPDGLRGSAIPIEARVVLACDAYHAMTSDRPYRSAIGYAAATAQLRQHAGTTFDPTVADVLLTVLSLLPADQQS